MKKLIFLFFLFFKLLPAQSYNTIIEYIVKNHEGDANAILISNNQENIFFHCKSNLDIDYEKLDKVNYNDIRPDLIFKFDKKSNTYFQTMPLFLAGDPGFSSELAKDMAPAPKWDITKEKKIILDYNCIKATTNFRGRIWTVWFTTDVSGDVFPWKLRGLPGAILEVSESKNILSLKATKIVLNANYLQPKILENLFSKFSSNATDYKTVIEFDNKGLKDIQNKQIANYPAGTVFLEIPNIREGLLEKTFEWEEEPKKP